MKEFKRYLLTAALPYANGPVHIGHMAGVYLPADIYARYLRAKKLDVKFVSGTDEHGVPITIRAMKENVSPQEIVDRYYKIIKESFEEMGISFDIFSRTSKEIHHKTSQDFFLNLYNKGLFEERDAEQYFDEEKQIFLADRYITGTCPICGNPNAYGDQCEKCGSSLSPEQLINPRSVLSDAIPIKKKTKHWYFPLQDYENFLRQWILEDHKDWKTNVYGQCKSWLDKGLQPRAMTRDSNWGVKVPTPPAPEGGGGKVLYVWFDAPIGYISATKELTQNWEGYWCKDDTKLVHFIGKDNIVFHCIIFPAMLKAHGDFVLPENVPANEFLNIEGQKVSTSRNWAVWVDEYLKDFPGQQDVLRYVLCANAPETKDNDFTWKDFQDRNNSELVAIFGNFVNRTFVLMHKLCKGKVPPLHKSALDDVDKKMIEEFSITKSKIENLLEQFKFRDALFEVIDLARKGNKYLQVKEPWKKASPNPSKEGDFKTPSISANLTNIEDSQNPPLEGREAVDNCLHICLQLCANLAIFINPFLPFTAKKMIHMMKVLERMLEWENGGKLKLLSVGYSLRAPELLFRKIEDSEVEAQIAKLNNGLAESETQKAEAGKQKAVTSKKLSVMSDQITENKAEVNSNTSNLKPEIVFDDFAKIDLKVGTILSAEKVEKADKLLKLEIDLGIGKRIILSGIAQHFSPDEIIGKQVVVVANLAPRKMRGIESNGMILMAEDEKGKLHFVKPENVIENGSGVS